MKTNIKKWGNSLGIRIPKYIAKEVNLKEGDSIDLKIKNNEIVLKPIKEKNKLDKLLKKINKNNIHKEIDTGNNVGNEIW